MDPVRTVLVVHGEDVDGIMSAVVLSAEFGPEAEVHFVPYGRYTEMFQALCASDALVGADVVVADLALKPVLFSGHLIEKMMARARSIVWLDHHLSREVERFTALGGLYIDGSETGICACSLCVKWLGLSSSACVDTAMTGFLRESLAAASDYPEQCRDHDFLLLSEKLQRIITYFNFLERPDLLVKLVHNLAQTVEWQEFIVSQYQQIEQLFAQAEAELEQDQELVEVGPYRFLLAVVSPILPQKEALRKLRQSDESVAAYIGLFTKPVLNALVFGGQQNSAFPVQDFCKFYGGGGRENDGGFSLSPMVDWQDFAVAKGELIALIKGYLEPGN